MPFLLYLAKTSSPETLQADKLLLVFASVLELRPIATSTSL